MTVRFACEKDIPQMNSLLYQVERVHQQGRPDLFKEVAKSILITSLKICSRIKPSLYLPQLMKMM